MKFIDGDEPVLEVTRRNLLTLLAKLDDPDSKRTLIAPCGQISVRAVEDDAHYADRPPGPVLINGTIDTGEDGHDRRLFADGRWGCGESGCKACY